ncbi:DNA repair exonuclease [Methylocystis echinoides]|uniref:metallophosphoesterase family protein n=1 Tax=Methylocystis echinoides TaxID=29468 RepID=UPI003446E7E1
MHEYASKAAIFINFPDGGISVAFRFVHSADIHLDSPLRSLALLNPELGKLIGNATRRAFQNIVDLCIDEKVDALVLAGDLYDGDQTSMKTAKFFANEMNRLAQAGAQVFIVRGNHDAETKISNQLTMPAAVTVFTGRADFVEIRAKGGGLPVAIHGMSFSSPTVSSSLLPKYKAPVEGAFNIGVLHTSLTGADGHNNYSPCTLAELQAFGYRYWALGHVHKRAVYNGACTVVMPGNPQGRDINESGPKSATLVTIHDDGSVELEERFTSIAEFVRIPVVVEGCGDWGGVVIAMRRAIEKARGVARSNHLVGRIMLSGATLAAWDLRAKDLLLKAEADSFAGTAGNTWIESIDNACTRPTALATISETGDTLAELMEEIEGGVLSSPAFVMETEEIATELLKALPRECHGALGGSNEAAFKAEIEKLAREGAEEVLARLRVDTGAGTEGY